ncbi:MAG: SUMF1/EgtB/PvdO family nonheme iron enzyme, partial [Myxococcales bacterium]|nr:SUMF1/EgtB/PvdO family nonheme iron enzyme [Myxococcales bacterium]
MSRAPASTHPKATGRPLLLALVCLAGSGCWLALDLEDNEYTRGAGASSGGAGGTAALGGGGSSDIHAGMVFVEHGDADFYIDATEVTNAAYAAWLKQSPAPSPAQIDDSRCAWNTSFAPGALDTCSDPDTLCDAFGETFDELSVTAPDRPVACIDWCDALAFCELNGKHLCGGPGGARIEFNPDFPGAYTTSISEWFFACGGDAELAYPYGNSLEPARCNDDTNGLGTIVDVGSMEGCEGSFPGVFDLSGNAEEWVNACYLGDDPA